MASSETILDSRTDERTLLFRVGERVFGCDIDAVREIIPYRRATRLPGAPKSVQGLINLRGTIVTVLDVGSRLDAERPPVRDGSIILVDHGTRVVGVAVDEVMDVRLITEEPIASSTGAGALAGAGGDDAPRGLVRGLGHLDDSVVVLMDIQALVTQVLL